MPPADKKTDCIDREHTKLTTGDLHIILEVNKKAIELQMETEEQFEEILEHLKYLKPKIDELDRALFRLLVILGTIGAGTIIGVFLAVFKMLLT